MFLLFVQEHIKHEMARKIKRQTKYIQNLNFHFLLYLSSLHVFKICQFPLLSKDLLNGSIFSPPLMLSA
jgi:hypothetical protein